MPEKDPTTYSILTYLWVAGLATWGGVVSYIRRVQEGTARITLLSFVKEILTSALCGVVTFWLCELGQVPPLFSAVLIAISGHMGSRLLFMLENRYFGGTGSGQSY